MIGPRYAFYLSCVDSRGWDGAGENRSTFALSIYKGLRLDGPRPDVKVLARVRFPVEMITVIRQVHDEIWDRVRVDDRELSDWFLVT